VENFTPISATIGGILIGLSAVLLMAGAGRIAGISGILGGLSNDREGLTWRSPFLAGLILVPFLMVLANPEYGYALFKTEKWVLLAAGILVGIGTQMGNGCTSGHGVCGNARLSERSITATLIFLTVGMATVFVSRYLGLYW